MINFDNLGNKAITYYMQCAYQKPIGKWAFDSTGVAYIRDLAEFSVKYVLNTIWHDSNKEQPDGEKMVVAFNNEGGEVKKFCKVNPNYQWAYIEDLIVPSIDEPVAPTAKDIKAYRDYWQQIMEKNFGELTVSYKPTKDQLNALKAIVLSLRQKAMTSNSRNIQYENLWDLYNNLKELK